MIGLFWVVVWWIYLVVLELRVLVLAVRNSELPYAVIAVLVNRRVHIPACWICWLILIRN
mgnify:CR=1 FL=1